MEHSTYSLCKSWQSVVGASDWLKICFIQSRALPRSGQWHVIIMKFLHLLLRQHLTGKPTGVSRTVSCFHTLCSQQHATVSETYWLILILPNYDFFCYFPLNIEEPISFLRKLPMNVPHGIVLTWLFRNCSFSLFSF